MSSVADRNRAKKARTINRAKSPKAETPRPSTVKSAKSERIEDRDGLSWLYRKGQITTPQFLAASAYRKAYREPAAGALKSFLGNPERSGGASGQGFPPDYNAAAYDAARLLTEYRAALSFGTGMVLIMDGIAGGGSTPRSMAAGNAKLGIENLQTFRLACDYLATHLRGEPDEMSQRRQA